MDRRVFAASLIILLVAAPAVSTLGSGSPSYEVEDLGTTSDGLVPTVTGTNASGQVSGYVSTPVGLRAVRYTNGTGWVYVPGLQGSLSVATSINASGDLAGYYQVPGVGLRAFRYVDGVGVAQIQILPGFTSAQGMAIADNGEVVGHFNTGLSQRAWRTGPGYGNLPIIVAPLSATASSACGVNGAGQLVGSFTTGGFQHAYRLEANESLTDIGTLGVTTSSACGLDANGRVGGQSKVGTDTHAFVFTGGAPTDVHTFVSAFSTIMAMANGVGVGSFTFAPGQNHAFVHTDADGATDLNSTIPAGSSWVLTDARAVSSTGQIVGHGLLAGVPRVFRLTPGGTAVDTTAPVIESASATPSSVTPPNKLLVDVAFTVAATDDQDPTPVCAASAVDGHGAPSGDFSITGPLSGRVRATGGATYSFTISCTDDAGNASSTSVDVVVPPDTTLPVFTSLTATPSTIWPPKGQMVTVTTSASATDDSGETPTCTLDSITGPGTSPADFSVTGANTGSVKAVGGRTYTFNETCVDGSGNGAWSSVTVTVLPDVTAPVIAALTATPSSVPPTGAMVPIALSVSATDDVDDAPSCALAAITSAGAPAGDFAITGPLSASVRAVGGRTYSLRVACSDAAGNSRDASVDVVVPADTTAPVITQLSASPGYIWPPNHQMEQVTLSVTATDNLDSAPQCSLTSITGAPAGSFAILGALTANVRADKDAVYSLNVTCQDLAGNQAQGSVAVAVSKDAPVAAANKKK
jgi:probable HAF family extracellular repeat protein